MKLRLLTALCLAFALPVAHAQLRIEITSGVRDPINIAVVPFSGGTAAPGGFDVAQVVQQDLESSGRFKGLRRQSMRTTPTRSEQVAVEDWKADGSDYIVVGRVSPVAGGSQFRVDFELINLLTGQRLANQGFTAVPGALRNAAHRVSDVVFEKILGVRGAFATRIAYVAVSGTPPSKRWQLMIADADGENFRPIAESRYPIMSPAWSPDGQMLAYVSFENRASSVFVQELRTGKRTQVSAKAGVNGAPAWAPDGKTLALTLGGSGGNPDIWLLDLATNNLSKQTDDPSIDTEPAWSPDGKSLYFTSDRAGGPQIYRVTPGSRERPKRITFGSGYAARPRVSPDGQEIAMVTLDGNNYRVAVQDLASSTMRVLSRGRLDESPSYAPNGAMLIFSGREGGQTVLATVSVDGLTSQRLKSEQGDVREPVWGPFLQ